MMLFDLINVLPLYGSGVIVADIDNGETTICDYLCHDNFEPCYADYRVVSIDITYDVERCENRLYVLVTLNK